jgi:hypothetical protein
MRHRAFILGSLLLFAVTPAAPMLLFDDETGIVVPATDYRAKMQAMVAEAQPEGENAWPMIREISARFMKIHERAEAKAEEAGIERDEEDLLEPEYWRVAPLGPIPDRLSENVARELAVLEQVEAAGVWDDLHRIVGMPRAVREQTGDGPIIAGDDACISTGLTPTRLMTMARVATMRRAAEREAWDSVIRVVEEMLALARLTSWQSPDNLAASYGSWIARYTMIELSLIVVERDLDQESLERLLDVIRDRRPMLPASMMLKGERYRLLDLVQWIYTDDGSLAALPEQLCRAEVSPAELVDGPRPIIDGQPTRAETVAQLETMFNLLNEYAERPPSKWPPLSDRREEWMDKLHGVQNALLIDVSGTLPARIRNIRVAELMMRGVEIMVALEIHEARSGTYPGSLDELVPDLLDELPTDPTHDGPFGYRQLANDKYGRGYLLYSFGWDATDNNGRLPETPYLGRFDAVMSIKTGAGLDFVINLPPDHPILKTE